MKRQTTDTTTPAAVRIAYTRESAPSRDTEADAVPLYGLTVVEHESESDRARFLALFVTLRAIRESSSD